MASYVDRLRYLTANPAEIEKPLWSTNDLARRRAMVALRERAFYRRWLHEQGPDSDVTRFRPVSAERVTASATDYAEESPESPSADLSADL